MDKFAELKFSIFLEKVFLSLVLEFIKFLTNVVLVSYKPVSYKTIYVKNSIRYINRK